MGAREMGLIAGEAPPGWEIVTKCPLQFMMAKDRRIRTP
jgi:hypothetical protein